MSFKIIMTKTRMRERETSRAKPRKATLAFCSPPFFNSYLAKELFLVMNVCVVLFSLLILYSSLHSSFSSSSSSSSFSSSLIVVFLVVFVSHFCFS